MLTEATPELTEMSGADALDTLLDVVENGQKASIGGYVINRIGSIEHTAPPRDIIVTASAVGGQALKFAFGSGDEPVIDYSLQVLGTSRSDR